MIDTHCHLDDKRLNEDEIIKNMHIDGLDKIITIATNKDDVENVIDIAHKDKDVYACIAIHPYYVDKYNDEIESMIERLSKDDKVVGIGEFGLDYHDYPGIPSREIQKDVFVREIKLAHRLKLPMCLHIRDAHGDAVEILKENKKYLTYGGIIHCFSGSVEIAKEYVKLGFYISFSGSITYKKAYEDIIKAIPLERILIETDAPYLSPNPLRGELNVPKNSLITAQFVADTLEMNYKKFEEIEKNNTYFLFKKLK